MNINVNNGPVKPLNFTLTPDQTIKKNLKISELKKEFGNRTATSLSNLLTQYSDADSEKEKTALEQLILRVISITEDSDFIKFCDLHEKIQATDGNKIKKAFSKKRRDLFNSLFSKQLNNPNVDKKSFVHSIYYISGTADIKTKGIIEKTLSELNKKNPEDSLKIKKLTALQRFQKVLSKSEVSRRVVSLVTPEGSHEDVDIKIHRHSAPSTVNEAPKEDLKGSLLTTIFDEIKSYEPMGNLKDFRKEAKGLANILNQLSCKLFLEMDWRKNGARGDEFLKDRLDFANQVSYLVASLTYLENTDYLPHYYTLFALAAHYAIKKHGDYHTAYAIYGGLNAGFIQNKIKTEQRESLKGEVDQIVKHLDHLFSTEAKFKNMIMEENHSLQSGFPCIPSIVPTLNEIETHQNTAFVLESLGALFLDMEQIRDLYPKHYSQEICKDVSNHLGRFGEDFNSKVKDYEKANPKELQGPDGYMESVWNKNYEEKVKEDFHQKYFG